MILREEAKHVMVTAAQAVAIHKLWERHNEDGRGKRDFIPFEDWFYSHVSPSFEPGLFMVAYAGMQLGVEKDGYTHS